MTARALFSELAEINPRVPLEKGAEYPFVEMGTVTPRVRYVRASGTRSFTNGGARFLAGDILFARITPCLENGKIAQFRDAPGTLAFGSTEFFVLRHREGVSDPGFVYYTALSEHVRGAAIKSMTGASGRQRADLNTVGNVAVYAPPLPVQQKVAAVLTAYDNLIENNTRRIAILEEMARSLYREWFVNFRFPGHENVDMVESGMGSIPQGWNVVTTSTAIGISPPTKVLKDGEKPFVPMNGLSNDSMVITNIETRTGNSGAKFKKGDTLFARITPCLENGKTGFVQFLPSDASVAFGSTEFIVLRSRTLSPEFVYLMARSDSFRDNAIKSMSGATGRQRVQEACFDRFHFAHPPTDLVERFSEMTSPNFRSIHLLHEKNRVLRNTRDLLLPRLISGELDVSDLDIDTGELST